MKILVLNGSPKKKSDTMQLTNAFLEGVNENGNNEIEIINVIDKNIQPCRGCFGCWAKGDGKCVIDDDQNEILNKYQNSDLVIWSFPLYCFGMPSHLKAVLDRIIPLVKMDMVEKDGEVRHVPRADFSGITNIVICGAGFPMSVGNFDGVSIMADKCFGVCTKIFVPETPLMNVPEAASVTTPKKECFVNAGREYNQTGMLSKETIENMESLMIPNADYIKSINGE